VAVGFWLLNSVSAGEAALFVGFELAFVVLPGCLAYLALSGGPRPALRVAVCGAALGYALGVGFYIAASASGANAIFLAWPAVVGIPALVALWRRPRPWIEARSWSRGELAAATFVAGALLLSVAIALSDQAAIPGELYGNRYHHDLLWEVARAGEAKHVWPLDVPSLAGEPLRYHYLANLNEAAIGEFTGIDQALVNFRLAPIPLLLVVVGGLIELGRSLSGRAWGGVLCAVLVLAVGRFDPLPVPPGEFFKNLYLSDSFLFGLALFLPLVCELVDRIRAGAARVGARAGAAGPGARAGPWVVIAILMAGCGGGKATILPVLCGGLGICLAYALWRRREQVRAVAIGLALSVISGVASYLAFYRVEAGKSDLEAVPFAIAKRTGEFVDLNRDLPDARSNRRWGRWRCSPR
jgi:hypothetical protein